MFAHSEAEEADEEMMEMEDGPMDGDSTGPQGDPEGQDGPHPEGGMSW